MTNCGKLTYGTLVKIIVYPAWRFGQLIKIRFNWDIQIQVVEMGDIRVENLFVDEYGKYIKMMKTVSPGAIKLKWNGWC